MVSDDITRVVKVLFVANLGLILATIPLVRLLHS